MSLTISDRELQELRLTEKEFRTEMAVYLYDMQKLSLGKAAAFAHLDRLAFQQELAKRNIFLKYTKEDLHHDIETLNSLNF
jgi:predicted HTH domain antitoxin